MIVDELILKLQADLSDVKKKLAQVEVDAAKAGKDAGAAMGKAAGTSFSDVFGAIAGAAVLNTVKNFYSKAAQEFNKFEAAFLRVDSIAKGFGRSVSEARKQVEQLADKGFLNLNQAASSYADAIALGFDEKQARKFIDSLSDIAAFQNTIGDGAAAVQSGLAGLLSNSAEKVENIGVPVKVLNMQYNENIKTMGKAAALQKFYNGILKESEKFQGDAARAVDTLAGAQNKANAATDRAMVAIGKGLEPILKKLYNTIEDDAKWFAKWFDGLDATTKAIVLLTPLVAALALALGTLLPILRLISISNPFGWVAIAITGLGALVAVLNEVQAAAKPENIVKSYKQQATEMEKLGSRARELESINKRTADQERELIKIKQALSEKAIALGQDYNKLAQEVGNTADKFEILTRRERENAAAKLRIQLTEAQSKTSESEKAVTDALARGENPYIQDNKIAQRILLGLATAPLGGAGALLLKSSNIGAERDAALKNEKAIIDAYVKLYQPEGMEAGAMQSASSAGQKRNEQRFLESQQKLEQIAADKAYTIRKILSERLSNEEKVRRISDAEDAARILVQAETRQLRAGIAEYIEEKYIAEKINLDQQRDDQIANVRKLVIAKSISEKEAEEEIQKIREANVRKTAKLSLDSFSQTAQAANATGQGLAQLGRSKDFAGGLSGIGATASGVSGFSDKLKPLGIAGAGIAAAAGLVGLIAGLAGKSQEELQKEEAEAERRHQEQIKILELQANYQKDMLALQEAAAKTPFENLQRNLRLIDIQAQQQRLAGKSESEVEATRLASRRSAMQSTLSEQGGKIGEGALFEGVKATPESLIAFMNERAEQALAIAQFNALIQSTADPNMTYGRMMAIYDIARTYSGKIPAKLYNLGIEGIQRITDVFKNTTNQNVGQLQENLQVASRFLAPARDISSTLVSEISTDTNRAESLLSVFQDSLQVELDIRDSSRKTAENTSKALELRPDRERSFIDVGRGFIQSLGQVITTPSAMAIAQQMAAQNIGVPAEIGSATVTMGRARTLQERMADAMDRQVMQGAEALDIAYDMRAALYDLLAVLDANPNTQNKISVTEFTRAQSEINRRRT